MISKALTFLSMFCTIQSEASVFDCVVKT